MSMPVLKLRQVVGFPGNIVGGTGIDATKANGTVTIDTDWSNFPSLSTIPTSPTNNVLSYDTLTGVYALVPTPLLSGDISVNVNAGDLIGTTLAPNVVNSSLHTVGTLTGGSTGAGFTVALGSSTITGTLPVANGGTGATTGAAALTNLGGLPLTGGTLSGPLILAADPSAALGAVTKQYVDNIATGLSVKGAVRVATTTSGTLASSFANGSAIDGVTLATGDRILIKNQASAAENGIYTVNATGAPTRATDLDASSEAIGAYTFVSAGSTQANTGWVTQVASGFVLGTNNMPWGQFSSQVSYTAGPGVSLSGTNFLLAPGAVTSAMLANYVSVDKGGLGADFSASTGIPLVTAGTPATYSVLGTNGTGNVLRAAGPTMSNPTATGTLTAATITASGTLGVTGVTTLSGNLSAAGNVGIGTTTPATKLEVVGNILIPNNTGYQARQTGAGTPANIMYIDTGNNVQLGGGLDVAITALHPQLAFSVAGGISAGGAFFKNGQPWADVKAWGALANGSNDAPAIQNAIDYMASTYGGGIVFFPPGSYLVQTTLVLKKGVILMGAGQRCTAISSGGVDIRVVTIGVAPFNGRDGNGVEKLSVVGNTTASSATAVVYIEHNVSGYMRDCEIIGGYYAMQTGGVDFTYDNVNFLSTSSLAGGACVWNNGGGWFVRCKIDNSNVVTYGLHVGWNGASDIAESHFFQCDVSGPFTNACVRIDDGGNFNSTNIFEGCVFGPQGAGGGVEMDNFLWTAMSACEIGGNVTGAVSSGAHNRCSIVGSYGFTGITASGCNGASAGNINISGLV